MTNNKFSKSALQALKLPELKELAKKQGIKRISTMKKQELIDALLAAQGNASDDADTKADTPKADHKSEPTTRRRVRRTNKNDKNDTDKQTLDVKKELKQDLDKANKHHDKGDSKAKEPDVDLPESNDDNSNKNRRNRNTRRRRDRSDDNRNRDNRNNRDNRDNRNRNDNKRDDSDKKDDVLLPIAGILDIQSNHAFVRTSGYLPGPNDIYVTLGQVRRWALRSGDAIVGAVRPRNEDEQKNRRQKYNALVRLDTINGMSIDDARGRQQFKDLTPLYPQDQLRLETTGKNLTTRAIDLVAPIGKGQRGLIVSPPKAGKTIILQQIANAISQNNPECHLMVVLVDERPEEVTDMQRTVKGEVIASTFDRPASDHTTVAELAIERAKRLVELNQDVVILLDSITRLGRAYNLAAPASGRILSGGVDASALYPPKKFFGAARNVEGGGSLTILATALVETGSKMDEVIFEEFKGTGNMELRLSRELANRRIFPAVDVNASGTRREELLLTKEELAITWKLRRMLGQLEGTKPTEFVLSQLKDTGSNAEFLMALAKMTPSKD